MIYVSFVNPVDDIPDHVRHLLLEPVESHVGSVTSPTGNNPKSPQSPTSDEEGEFCGNLTSVKGASD